MSLENLINSIQEGIQQLRNGELNSQDFDRVFQNTRALYERITVLRYQAMKEEIDENEFLDVLEFEAPIAFDFSEVKEEAPPPEPRVTVVEQEPENQISLIDVIKEEEQSINDKLSQSGQKATLNEVLANVEEELKTVGDKIISGKVFDINDAIQINEKYLFTNDLFASDNEAYKIAIKMLNGMDTMEDVNHFIDTELREQYSWFDANPETIDQFMQIIERKFI